jgi:parallel beta-helix repeat protein
MALTKVSYAMVTGAVANVLDYGAVGNGVANDKAAIQAALDSGLPVYLPSGTYLIGSPLETDDNAIILSENATLKASASFDGTGYTYKSMITTAQSGTNDGLTVRGLIIDGSSVASLVGVCAFACDNLVIENCTIKNCPTGIFDYGNGANLLNQRISGNTIYGGANGISVSAVDGRNIVISKNYVYDHTSSGIPLQSSNELLVEQNTCYNNGTVNGNGIFIKGCENVRVIGNYCHYNSYVALAGSAIGINMTGAFTNRNISIIGNVLTYSGDDAIDAYCENGASNIDVLIQGNLMYNNLSGINVSTDGGASVQRGYTITGNIIHNNKQSGIKLENANYCNVTGNSVYDNSTANPGNYSGIYGIELLNSAVVGNTVYQSAGVQNGIIFDGSPVGNVVSDNFVTSTSIVYSLNNPLNNSYNVVRKNSVTYNPPSLNDGDGTTTTVTVTGAALGDFATASFSNDLQGITLTAWVSASNTVSVRFQNESGGVLDLASGTLEAKVVSK